MLVRFQLQHAKAWVWYLRSNCLFLANKTFSANMPELVQGGALKMLCVRTRGFEPHWMHIVVYLLKVEIRSYSSVG